jgi:60 kDa SS-A/Ro ribonucleoprotein
MSVKTYTKFSTRKTSQSEKIPGSTQVPNSAGGFAWELDKWGRLDRFLVIGTESGTYYINEQTLTKENANVVIECLQEDGIRVVNRIVEISEAGRAAKNDPAIFALAMSISLGDEATRKLAATSLSKVCRIGTHLFHFAQFVEQFRGWGRLLKGAVAGWYENQEASNLAYQVVKYRQRDGWSHRDLLRLSHPSNLSPNSEIFDWVAGKNDDARGSGAVASFNIIRGYEDAQVITEPEGWVNVIKEFNLPREALPTEALKSKEVWGALLEKMPMTAMIRNLGNMSKVGLLTPMSSAATRVIQQLNNQEAITKARVHPIQILAAMLTYESGHGARGSGEWEVVTPVVDALDGAFYKSFGNVVPSNKRTMLALDVSGSMSYADVMNIPGLTAMKGAAAMSLITAATEPNYMTTAFASAGGSRVYSGMHVGYHGNSSNIDDGMRKISISPRMRLDSVIKEISNLPFGGTDCALPMLYALKHNIDIDTFITYTDSETWAGSIHPTQALKQYREKTGINAKLIVVGMTSNGFTIADPADAGMLDVVGFDTATPQLISNFSTGF